MRPTDYSLSIHMTVHILLLLVCGPLIVAGLPKRWTDSTAVYRFSHFLSRRLWLAWMGGTAMMWFWHIPVIHNWTMTVADKYSLFPFFQALLLLTGGMLFSWPLIGPQACCRIHPLSGVVYLATACISCSLMGLLITFAPPGIYHDIVGGRAMQMAHGIAAHSPDSRRDMQTAGLIMWIPGCMIYLAGCLLLLVRWFREEATPGSIYT